MGKTRRKLRILTVFLLVMCFALLIGQGSSEGEPNSAKSIWHYFMESRFYIVEPAVDGYFWRKMPKVQKLGYITGYGRGFIEGVAAAWAAATGNTQWPFKLLAERISYEGLVEGVDQFYSDYANRQIYLSSALPIIICRIGGYISDEEAKDRIQEARRQASRIPKAR